MAGVARKIEIARQLEEARATASEPPTAATPRLADERLARRRAIVVTLEFNAAHEHLFRAWLAERKGDGMRLRLRGGRLCWASQLGPDTFFPLVDDEANELLARLDAPATQEKSE